MEKMKGEDRDQKGGAKSSKGREKPLSGQIYK